jgi:hypothetical protein
MTPKIPTKLSGRPKLGTLNLIESDIFFSPASQRKISGIYHASAHWSTHQIIPLSGHLLKSAIREMHLTKKSPKISGTIDIFILWWLFKYIGIDMRSVI